MTKNRSKLGLMGGTFNPIHLGHLRAAEEAAEALALDRVVFIPAAAPPHKEPSPLLSFADRLAMVRLAADRRPGFYASPVEGERQGPSYTIDTLKHFKSIHGDDVDLYFITGLDAFLEIDTWMNHKELFSLAEFVVVSRPGNDSGRLGQYINTVIDKNYQEQDGLFVAKNYLPIYYQSILKMDISSSDIRARIKRGASIRYLVIDQVRDYIIEHGHYLD